MGNFPQHFPQDFPTRFPSKIFLQDFLQDFPTRFSHKNFPQDFPKLDPDWLAPHHPIPNAKFPPITALLNRPTYHKRSKVSPPPFPQILWEPQINERFSRKNFLQQFPATISHNNFPQDFPQQFPARISHKNFPQDFPARISRAAS